jgi:putative restriction endonuclease
MNAAMRAGILVTRRHPGYKDIPGVCYHFPKQLYARQVDALMGCFVLFYEPRRGGHSAQSQSGGRSAFTGGAFIERIDDDPDDAKHAFAWFRYAVDFNTIVPIAATAVPGQSLQSAVLEIPIAEAERIVAKGLTVDIGNQNPSDRVGLADVDELAHIQRRSVVEVTRNQRVRDQSFRYRVVERVYAGRCALTGICMTNGRGRAEADAAHIRPVERDGPDTVRNGIALMKSVHWAFDRGLISLSDDGRILTNDSGLDPSLRGLLRRDGLALFPKNADERPHPAFLRWHRENVFKGSAVA